MTVFKVQTFQTMSGSWKDVATFRPNYRLGLMRLGRRFWFKKLVGIASNFTEAEIEACEQATRLAKQLLKKRKWQTRILRESTWSGKEVKETLWQDGVVLLKLKAVLNRKL